MQMQNARKNILKSPGFVLAQSIHTYRRTNEASAQFILHIKQRGKCIVNLLHRGQYGRCLVYIYCIVDNVVGVHSEYCKVVNEAGAYCNILWIAVQYPDKLTQYTLVSDNN